MADAQDSVLEFPCRFPIKAMGKAGEDFDARVVQMVRRHAPDLTEAAVTVRQSSRGKWLSVTVVIEATGKDQLDAIYQDLTNDEKVVWAI